MAGTLYIVATPIGHLEDITLRALRILREVELVAAEDTRRTGNLLRHYEIHTRLISFHEHNERQRVPQLLARLEEGQSIALVSDAGTPAISDPGTGLVRAARDAGITVVPIPGPSAVTTALSASGIDAGRFVFGGFPPVRSKDRKQWFAWATGFPSTPLICFEAPHRLRKTLGDIAEYLGNRPIIVARELTKVHEEWREGTAEELIEHFSEPQGECVLVVLPRSDAESANENASLVPDDESISALFGQITEIGVSDRRSAVREAASRLGLSTKAVYDAVERAKKLPK